jgi:predicted Zn-dependent protease with MMP-like domain
MAGEFMTKDQKDLKDCKDIKQGPLVLAVLEVLYVLYNLPMRIPPEEFEALVEQALEGLPEEFAELLDNVAILVEEEPDPEELEALGMAPDEELFGLYLGVPLSERDSFYMGALPDRVILYRGPIIRACENRRQVIREVRDTLVHELGHHFGMEEEDMPY